MASSGARRPEAPGAPPRPCSSPAESGRPRRRPQPPGSPCPAIAGDAHEEGPPSPARAPDSPPASARAKLFALLDNFEQSPEAAEWSNPAHMLSGESRERFKRFIRGYASSAARRLGAPQRSRGSAGGGDGWNRSASGDGEALVGVSTSVASAHAAAAATAAAVPSRAESAAFFAQLVGDMDHGEGRPMSARDHYDYFACLPVDMELGPEERKARMRALRQHLWSARLSTCRRKSTEAPGPQKKAPQRAPAEEAEPARGLDASGKLAVPGQTSKDASKGAQDAARATSGDGKGVGSSATASANLKAEMRMREACESLRFLVFGHAISEAKAKDSAAYEQKCGTKEEVAKLQAVWSEMDEDGSGDVEFQEFVSFFSRNKADRLLGMRCVNYLVGKAKDEGIDDKEMGCTIEDMMRLMWLKASDEDVHRMKHWFHEAEFQRHRAPTPPLLTKRRSHQIMENFPRLDWEKTDAVTFHELVEYGHIDEGTMKGLRDQMQKSSLDKVSKLEFLEMLCPRGFRAHPSVRTCVDKLGRPLVWISNEYFSGWVIADKLRGPQRAQDPEDRPDE